MPKRQIQTATNTAVSDGDKDRKAKYAKREANEIAEEKNTDIACSESESHAGDNSSVSSEAPSQSDSSQSDSELYNFEALTINKNKRG